MKHEITIGNVFVKKRKNSPLKKATIVIMIMIVIVIVIMIMIIYIMIIIIIMIVIMMLDVHLGSRKAMATIRTAGVAGWRETLENLFVFFYLYLYLYLYIWRRQLSCGRRKKI